MDREEIAQRIRERLRSGDLPRQRQARMWGGSGAGLPCRGCGEVIATDDLEIEVQFLTADGFSARRFHTLRYAVCGRWSGMKTDARSSSIMGTLARTAGNPAHQVA